MALIRYLKGLSIDGNVGIGTASPLAKLDVSDSIPVLRITGTRNASWTIGQTMASLEYFSEDASGSSANSVRASVNLVNETSVYGSTTGLSFSTKGDVTGSPIEAMRIASSGNVGIGTTSPLSKLQVDGGIQMAGDTATAAATKVGTMRYRTGTEYVEVTGTELVVNGDFATDSDWTKGAGWTIANGIATLTAQGASSSLSSSNIAVTSGSIYKVVVNVLTRGNSFRLYDSYGVVSYGLTVGINTHYITMSTASYNIIPLGLAGAFGTIESVSMVEVTSEDASYADMCMQTGASTYEWVNIVRNTY